MNDDGEMVDGDVDEVDEMDNLEGGVNLDDEEDDG